MKVVIISGGFDPIHSGHISYIQHAKSLGDYLVVALNSDEWLARKKSKPFMNFNERLTIISNLKDVDHVYAVNDDDGSVTGSIRYCLKEYPSADIIFANGGDRTKTNIPEMSISDKRVSFVFGIGGQDKQNSSSKILSEWKDPKTYRDWGYYRVLYTNGPETKTKELVVNPHSKLSLQRHQHRSEHWMVAEGSATIKVGPTLEELKTITLQKHETVEIPKTYWHQLINNTQTDLKIVEIQYGTLCIEEDIERINI